MRELGEQHTHLARGSIESVLIKSPATCIACHVPLSFGVVGQSNESLITVPYHCIPHQHLLHGDSPPLPTHGGCSWPATPLLFCSPHRPTMSRQWSVQTGSMEQDEIPQQIPTGGRQSLPLMSQNCLHKQTQMFLCSSLQFSLRSELLHPPSVQYH